MARNKRYLYKIYDSSGTYLKTIKDVVGDPKFTKSINGGIGECTFTLPNKITDFDELNSVFFNNEVRIICFDEDPDRFLINSMDSTTYNGAWSARDDANTLTQETNGDDGFVYRGFGALKWNVTVSALTASLYNTTMDPEDLSIYEGTGTFRIHHFFPITDFTNITGMKLRIGSSVSDYWEITVTENASGNPFQYGMQEIDFLWSAATPTGTPDSSDITYAEIFLTYGAGQANITAMRTDWLEYIADRPIQGVQVYSGYMSRYTPTISGHTEYVEVTLLSYVAELSRFVIEDADGNTTFTRSVEDPESMFRYLFDRFTASGGGSDYDGISTVPTGNTETYEFSLQTYLEGVEAVLDLCPTGYYFYLDANNIANLKPKAVAEDHRFILGKHFTRFKAVKNTENVINVLYFSGGDQTLDDAKHETINSTAQVGDTTVVYRAQQFLPTQNAIIGITFQIDSFVGSFTGDVVVSIQGDNGSDEPDGEKITEEIIANADFLALSTGTDIFLEINADLVDVASGQKYWIVFESTTSDASNYFRLKSDSAAGYADGIGKYSTDAVTWSLSTHDLYFKTHYAQKLYKKYTRAASISNYGTYSKVKVDSRVTDENSMDAIAERLLDDNEVPEIRMIFTIKDSAIDPDGYDIESIEPGQCIKIRNLIDTGFSQWDLMLWDEGFWDASVANIQERLVQIVSVQYEPDSVTITVSSRPPRIADTIEQINRDLRASQVSDNPDQPTS